MPTPLKIKPEDVEGLLREAALQLGPDLAGLLIKSANKINRQHLATVEDQEIMALHLEEISFLRKKVDRILGALKVIDSVVPSCTAGNSDDYVKEICARFINA